jgi:hypothetical protein
MRAAWPAVGEQVALNLLRTQTQTRDLPTRRVDGADLAAGSRPAGLSALDVWAFVLPAVSFIEITIVGQLYVSEILAAMMLPWLWSVRGRPSLPRWFVVLWAGWLLSQIVTDVVVGSTFADYARGWASIVLTFTNFAAILVLASTPRRARLFALGIAVGGVLGYVVFPGGFAVADPWKWALALPAALALAVILSGSRGSTYPWLAVGAFALLGLFDLYMGARSFGGQSLLTAGYLTLQAIVGRRRAAPNRSVLRAAVGLAFLCVAGLGVLQLYDVAVSGGLLGPAAQAKYEAQSGTYGVLVGGRSEILASTQAVIDSPILGHGSWAKDFNYVDLLTERLSDLGYEVGGTTSDVGLIPAHSHLMQSWVWAGLMGGVFWLAILFLAVWLLVSLYPFRLDLSPLLVLSTVLLVWTIAFDPYGLGGRIREPYELTLCLLGLRLLTGKGTTVAPPGSTNLEPRPQGPRRARTPSAWPGVQDHRPAPRPAGDNS